MSRLWLNLRDVPEDEADEVRALLDAQSIECYETVPSRWGFSAGGIWLSHDADIERATALLAGYQRQRQQRARDEFAQAAQDGRAPTLWTQLRDQPLRVIAAVLAAAALIALITLPFVSLR